MQIKEFPSAKLKNKKINFFRFLVKNKHYSSINTINDRPLLIKES